jgi:ABC-type bacteriocin/lantibiotic exporter with double-glycine peptidase domain
LLTHTETRETTEPFLTSETYRVGFELTYGLQFYLRLLFNLILNGLVLGAAIDLSLSFAFGLALAVLTLLQWLLRNPLAAAYFRSQQMTNRMTARTYNAWDNIFSGNRYNFAIWQRDFRRRVDSALLAQIKAILAREGWSAISGVIALIIVLYATARVVIADASNTALLIGLAATLPRQIEMTADMHQLTAGFNDMLALWTRIKGICAHMRPLPDPAFNQRMTLERMTLLEGDVEKRFSSLAEAAQYIRSRPTGLISIRGDNGVGKSTLLIVLKESLRDQAYYWPSHDRLSFDFNTETPNPVASARIMASSEPDEEPGEAEEIGARAPGRQGYSSGERQIKVLREIAERTDCRVYLLDEWDANLDAVNRARAQAIVDNLAQRSLVVEISHRDQT